MCACSWCGQEVKGRRIDFKVPRGPRIRVCRECSLGWSGLIAYTVGLIAEATRRKSVFPAGSFGSIGLRPHRSDR